MKRATTALRIRTPLRGFIRFVLGSALVTAAIANAAEDGNDDTEKSKQPSAQVDTAGLQRGCFYVRDVRDFEALNLQYLIVYAPNNRRAFLVYIAPPSVELRQAITLGFQGGNRICGRTGERLVFDRGPGMSRSANILDVWSLDETTVDRFIENKRARENPDVVPAEESPGAEVETDIKPNGEQPANDDG